MENKSKVTMKVINDKLLVMVKDSNNMAVANITKEEAILMLIDIAEQYGYAIVPEESRGVIGSFNIKDHICDGPVPY